MIHLGFVVERALGHATHGQNLQKNVMRDGSVVAEWAFPSQQAAGFAGKIPNWTVSAGLQARRGLASMQSRGRLDALFFHTQVTANLCLDWMRRIPSVVSLDATPIQYDALGESYDHQTGPAWLEQGKRRLNKASFQTARHLVTWSDWAKESLIEDYQISPGKITVIPPGVNLSDWQRPSQAIAESRRPVRILFVGGNLARKGGLVLLEAFDALRESWASEAANGSAPPELELHLVTRDAVLARPGIIVHNHMQPNSLELRQLYFNSDIFCLPTLGDCLPMVLSEAGAAGLPLVSTRVGAIPEIVRSEHTGILVSPGSVAELTGALRRLASDPALRRRLGQNAADLVRQEHDAARNADRLTGLLKRVAYEDRATH